MSETRISFLLNALVKEMNDQADSLLRARFSLTYSQFVFLQALRNGQSLDVTRLAEALGVTKAAVSKRLEWFVERGVVDTTRENDNAKRVLVSLSTEGRLLAAESGDFLDREFMRVISGVSSIDFARLAGDVLSLTTQMQQAKRMN